jgi:DNA-directed RNA polymerase subunit RPC12/RpoP
MLIPAAQYLTYVEAVQLYNELLAAEISALVKTCGPPSFPFGDGIWYQLLIEEAQAAAAHGIVEAFEAQRATVAVVRCPRCHSDDTAPQPRLTFWQRVFYAGTTLYECGACGRKFAV